MEIKNWSFEQLQDAGISIVGDPDYITEQIARIRMMGTDKIMMRPLFGRLRLCQVKKSLELMAKEVLPNLNKEKIVIPGSNCRFSDVRVSEEVPDEQEHSDPWGSIDPQAFYDEVARLNLSPLWLREGHPPHKRAVPWLWQWPVVREQMMRAA